MKKKYLFVFFFFFFVQQKIKEETKWTDQQQIATPSKFCTCTFMFSALVTKKGLNFFQLIQSFASPF